MSADPGQCWSLVREPNHLEPMPWVITNTRSDYGIGRHRPSNDKHCNGINVSRRHLRLSKCGGEDWTEVRWSVTDLGGMNGTFVNNRKIKPNEPQILNCNDLLGIGCNHQFSSEKTFVYRVLSPKALHKNVAPAEDSISSDNPTPPTSQTPQAEVPEEAREAGPSFTSPDSPVPSQKKRVRCLMSSSESDEEDEDVQNIKRPAKKRKSAVDDLRPVRVCVRSLKKPYCCVGAQVDEDDNILQWRTVTRGQYKTICRSWAGRGLSGVEGTPLQVEPKSESESDEDREEPPVASISGTSHRKDEAKKTDETNMNFSQVDEIIELLDSNDEDDYNNSQQNFHDLDRNSPSEKERLSEGEGSESDVHEENDFIEEEGDDDEESQILNESQNSLYYKIAKIKSRYQGENLQSPPQEVIDSDEDFLESERVIFEDIASCIDGADVKMVRRAYKSLEESQGGMPDRDQVFLMVIQQVEKRMLDKLSRSHEMTERQVKIIMLELKGDDRDRIVQETDLIEAILAQKKLNAISDDIVEKTSHSFEKVKKATNWMKTRKTEISKENLLLKLEEMKKVDEFVKITATQKHLDENLVRDTVNAEIDEAGIFVQQDVENLLATQIEALKKIELHQKELTKESSDDAMDIDDLLNDEEIEISERTQIEAFKKIELHQKELTKESSDDDMDIDDLLNDEEIEISERGEKPKAQLGAAATIDGGKSDRKAERMQRLKDIAEAQKKRTQSEPKKLPSSGVMKTSIPKNQTLLEEFQNQSEKAEKKSSSVKKSLPSTSGVRQRHLSDKTGARPTEKRERRNSLNFLEEEAKNDSESLHNKKSLQSKKEKYVDTYDGYKTPKKLSVHNVDYNIMSQDISKMPVPNAKPLQFEGIEPKIRAKKGSRRVQWKDLHGLRPLVEVREIEADNKGVKVQPGIMDGEFVRGGNRRKPENSPVRMNDVFKIVLNWNTSWLEEQKKVVEPPPVTGRFRVLPLLSTFSSLQDYVQIFLPLMFRELWSSVFQDYSERPQEPVLVALREVSPDESQQFKLIRCVALLSRKDRDREFDRDGWLATLDVRYKKDGAGGSNIKPCFGYVTDTDRTDLETYLSKPRDVDRPSVEMLKGEADRKTHRNPPAYVLRFTIKCKQELSSSSLAPDKPVYMRFLSRVKPELRKFEALLYLENSPLQDAIVKPTVKSFKVSQISEVLNPHIKDIFKNLNSVQKTNIVGMSRACLGDPLQPKVCLMQGPPGTGKSTTIVGLTLQLLYSGMKDGRKQTMPRVLIVAPSNAAVDSVARKLLNLREKIPEKIRFQLLRMGVVRSMDDQVKKFSLSNEVDRIVQKETEKVKNVDSLRKDIEQKQKSANKLYEEKMEAEEAGNTHLSSKLDRDYKGLQRQIQNLKSEIKKPLSSKEGRKIRMEAEYSVLSKADVILTTMSSSEMVGASYSRGLVHHLDRRKISVCIMDEASQCVEPEALIPLRLGFRKLVMVGDHEQLQATVTSTSARQLDYQQSLFGRLVSCLSAGDDGGRETAGSTPPMSFHRSPVLRLSTQYRMHPDIAVWPNRYFYGGLLRNADTPVATGRLVPYLVLNVESKEDSDRQQIFNKEEEAVVVNLVKAVNQICGKTPSIGIITFYNRQRQNISLQLQKEKLNCQDEIKVNTVDAFQGSERDVIFVSCVRGGAGGIGFVKEAQRLNVALTRAQRSLVVVGNMTTLASSHTLWREFVRDAKKRNLFYNFSSSQNVKNLKELLKST